MASNIATVTVNLDVEKLLPVIEDLTRKIKSDALAESHKRKARARAVIEQLKKVR